MVINKIKQLTDNQKISVFAAVLIFAFVLCFLGSELYINQFLDYSADSDNASELILANLLFQEKSILSVNWYYSTELRVLNTNLIFAPLFYFFTDWHMVRMVGTVIIHIIMLVSCYILCDKLGCRKMFPLAGIMLIMPLSYDYYNVVLRFPYYAPHISITFITLALMGYYAEQHSRLSDILILGSCFFLALLAGLGGARQVIVCFLPLFICACLLILPDIKTTLFADRNCFQARVLFFSFLCIVGCGAGYLINTRVLSSIYHFRVYDVHLTPFNIDNLKLFARSIPVVFGYREGLMKPSIAFHTCAAYTLPLISAVAAARGLFRKKHANRLYRYLSMFYLCSIGVLLLLYGFSDMTFERRYLLPTTVIAYPLIACFIADLSHHKKWLSAAVYAIVFAVSLGSGYCYYADRPFPSVKSDHQMIEEALMKKGYHYGYSTFWNANVLTELSDGAIEMHNFDYMITQAEGDINRSAPWLQLVKHDTEIPEGKVFLLFQKDEISANLDHSSDNNNLWKLTDDHIFYTVNDYVVYAYDSYTEMINEIYGKTG